MCARIVDHYELHEELGRGGMATVYRANDLRLEREVALKLLHEHIAAQPESRARFVREARAAARLRHPNILHIYDFSGEDAEVGYLATELIDGPNLRDMDARDLRTYPELAACLLWILSRALEEAHNAGVIHRDIKPENIMIDHAGQPRLMDFGLARVRDTQRMTMTGTLLGSPAHMAPEIIQGEEYDGRVDIFALGTVLYFLCTGRLPFEADTPATLLRKILDGHYTPAIEHNERIIRPLNDIIDRMLANDPDARFADAGALRKALAQMLDTLGIDAPDRTFQDWWTQGDAFMERWTPALICAVQEQAETAAAKGRGALNDALDWTNRLLTLDPQSDAGQDLLIRISTQSNRALRYQRIAMVVLTALAVAVPMLIARHFLQRPTASAYQQSSPLHAMIYAAQDRGQRTHARAAGAQLASHIDARSRALDAPQHVEAMELARSELHRAASRAEARSEAVAQRAARRAIRGTRRSDAPQDAPTPTQDQDDATSAGSTEPSAQTFTVRVLAQPPVSEVFVDGEKRCANASRCQLDLPEGRYEFMARHPATDMEARRTVKISQDHTNVRLRVPWKPATLIVECDRPGIVLLDGKRVGRTGDNIAVPIEGLHASKGAVLRVIPDGDFGVPIERNVQLSSGETRRERVQF